RRDAGAQQVRDRADRRRLQRRAGEQTGKAAGRHADVLQRVGQQQARVLGDQVAPGQRTAARAAHEREQELILAEQVEAERPLGVEEVEVLELQQEQLAQAGQLRLQGQQLAAPEQVVLRDLG